MLYRKYILVWNFISFLSLGLPSQAIAAEQPIAIFHAFNQNYNDVETFVCELANQGYSHVQISPSQESNPGNEWWKRYQPVNYNRIKGLGSGDDLKKLTDKAHGCNINVIADVVFNHMANLDNGEEFEDVTKYPGLSPSDFNIRPDTSPGQRNCDIDYNDGKRDTEIDCWLGSSLPDLKHTDNVKTIQKAHLKELLDLGVDGFRFDAAKHMPNHVVAEYINFINQESGGKAWNYLEVIEDGDTKAEDYNGIAAVTDFRLYRSLRGFFASEFNGDLRSLPATAINDNRSVTFGTNHDTIFALNDRAIDPYKDNADSFLASAYVLAREGGIPLIFNEDNLKVAYIKFGVMFRQIMDRRKKEGRNVKENILKVTNSPNIAFMERGVEGFFVANKGGRFDIPTLDLTLSNLEGCYRELREDFTIAIEQRDGKKLVSRWGTWQRGGMEIQGRDALYFIREPFTQCHTN